MDFIDTVGGFIAGIVIALIGVFALLFRIRARLQELDFHLTSPEVPVPLLNTVKQAEMRYFQELPLFRRGIEASQDVVALFWPQLAFALNISVGAYRIKPQTIHTLIQFAIEEKYLQMRIPEDYRFDSFLSYFSMQPALNDWQAALLLQKLKMKHPATMEVSWQQIGSSPRLVAKLYSGCMGAGGDWEAQVHTVASR
jgi:hypothetical protein